MWQQNSGSGAILLHSLERAIGLLLEMGTNCLFMSLQSSDTVLTHAISTQMIRGSRSPELKSHHASKSCILGPKQ